MRTLPLLLTTAVLAVSGSTASAGLVHTIDFSDALMWDVDITVIDSATDPGSGVINGGDGLRADKSNGSGAILVVATLIGTIDTTGFHSLELFFTNGGIGDKEFNDAVFFGMSGDGFDIMSSQGISFDTTSAGATFETALDAGTAWNPTNATSNGQDLAFASSVDNSSITNLVIRLQINANAEVIDLSGFSIQGTPEPSSMALMCVGLLGAFGVRSRRKKSVAAAA